MSPIPIEILIFAGLCFMAGYGLANGCLAGDAGANATDIGLADYFLG